MRTQMAYILIVLGLVSLISGIFMLSGDKESLTSLPSEKPSQIIQTPPVISFPAPKNKRSSIKIDYVKAEIKKTEKPTEKSISENNESKVKGDAFEKFVVQNFNKKYFRITEWRGDKFVNGTYAESNHYPDLEIRFQLGERQDLFAVECKWRKYLINDKLEWAKDYQFANYQRFAKKRNLPVFIIIGIRGTPDDPKRLYIIPLEKVTGAVLQTSELEQYIKNDEKNFYWNDQDNTLS